MFDIKVQVFPLHHVASREKSRTNDGSNNKQEWISSVDAVESGLNGTWRDFGEDREEITMGGVK